MAEVQHVRVRKGDVVALIGTMKGLFVFRSDSLRGRFERGGPYFQGHAIYASAIDDRGKKPRIWAAERSEHWGPQVSSSDDFGKTWDTPETRALRFPEGTDTTLRGIWQIQPGPEPGVLYAGVEPAALFRSDDHGESWSLVRGLWDHPHRAQWQPGGGGLCLHTILPDPKRPEVVTVAISTGGVYRTEDGGKNWRASNAGVTAAFLPDKHPEFGQCVHKIVHHPEEPDRMFLQNHWGLFRTDDGARSWQAIEDGVPSTFGFAMAMNPNDADTVYIVPLESDQFRCTPEGRLRVYRTRDGGSSWQPLTRGLPQANALETVLRDGMTTDPFDPCGVYFGTRSGKVYLSRDEGTSFKLLADGLPPVVSVKVGVIGGTAAARAAPARAKKRKRKTGKKPVRKVVAKKKVVRKKVRKKKAKPRRRRAA